jgi:uncharacterized protein (DUF488 family)
MRILTIGHSTRSIEEFIDVLQSNGIQIVVDIRTVPRSRHNPQFNADSLPQSLAAAGIGYVHPAELGGLRRPAHDSINTGWRNATFRGFADHMQTPGFEAAIEELVALARDKQAVIMCAEAVPWRCHRSLVADALTVRGIDVAHIIGGAMPRPHRLTPWAKVEGTRITYPTPSPERTVSPSSSLSPFGYAHSKPSREKD